MSQTKWHIIHIETLAIGAFSSVHPTLAHTPPTLYHPTQSHTHANTHRRLKEAEQRVRGGRNLARHLRHKHNDYKRDGGYASVVVDVQQHTQCLQNKDRHQHTHHREWQQFQINVGNQRTEKCAEHTQPGGSQSLLVGWYLQHGDNRRTRQHCTHPAGVGVYVSCGIYAHIVGYEDTHARDKYRDRVNSCHRRSDGGA